MGDIGGGVARMFGEMSYAYETWMRSWGAAESTITLRMGVARALVTSGVDPFTATREDVTDFLAGHGWVGWTLATYHSALRSLFGWMHDTGQIEANPMTGVRRPRTPKTRPKPVAPEQATRLLLRATPQVKAYLTLALYAGLRAHEIAAIEGRNVTQDGLYVVGKGRKPAHLPTHPLVWELALQYPQSLWFPADSASGHVTRETVSRKVAALMRAEGLSGSIHRCRHTFATMLLRSGVNIRVVQELMRHESLTSTQAYTLVEDEERTSAIAGLDFAA